MVPGPMTADYRPNSYNPDVPLFRLSVLGAYAVTVQDSDAARDLTRDLLSQRIPQLLGWLAAHPLTPVTRERIAQDVWADSGSDAQALTNLRKALHAIRSILPAGPDLLVQDGPLLTLAPGVEADAIRFQNAIAGADWGAAIAAYTGELLPGFDSDWLILAREAFRLAWLDALARHCAALEAAGQLPEALRHAQTLIAHEPLDETAHVRMMRLRALSGDRAGVLRAYRACEAALRRELDTSPSPQTQRALRRFIAVDTLRGAALPTPPTPFLGREAEIDACIAALTASNDPVRALTLLGPGGSGKTRLALEIARRLAPRFLHGAHFIDLSAAADTAALPIAVAGALGIQVEDAQALESHIRAELRERQALLVLDNFETVLPAARWLGEALTEAPDLICLITSREMLRIRAERVVHVGGLGDDAALALLAASTRRAGATHNVDDSPSLRRLCAVVQNMPLALEMAASQLGATGAGELAASLEESLRNLSAAWRDLPRRQQSLRAAFDYSWARLTPRERQIFADLCVFQGGFSRAGAATVSGADASALDLLAGRSLIRNVADARWDIHPVLREFGEQFQTDASETRRRRTAHIIETMTRLDQTAREPEPRHILSWLAEERDNVIAALRHAVDLPEFSLDTLESALRAAQRLAVAWRSVGHQNYLFQADIRRRMTERARRDGLAAAVASNRASELLYRQAAHALDPAAQRQALAELGEMLPALENEETALSARARALRCMGFIASFMPEHEIALASYEKSVDAYTRLAAREPALSMMSWGSISDMLNRSALIESERGRRAAAATLYLAAIDAAENAAPGRVTGGHNTPRSNLARNWVDEGEHAMGLDLVASALQEAINADLDQCQAFCHNVYAHALLADGRPAEAVEHAQAAIDYFTLREDWTDLAFGECTRALTLIDAARLSEAAESIARAEAAHAHAPLPANAALLALRRAELALARGQRVQAAALAGEAARLANAYGGRVIAANAGAIAAAAEGRLLDPPDPAMEARYRHWPGTILERPPR